MLVSRALLCLVFLALLAPVRGQSVPAPAPVGSPLTSLGFAAGVVTVDTKGRNWAYLAWGAGNAELVRGKTFAVYGKAGAPSAAAPFTRRAIVARQLDGRAVDSLLSRATFIGFHAAAIAPVMDELFTGTLPPGTNTPGEKIAAAMRSANPKSEQLLFLLGSLHPGVNFALGLGHAEKIAVGKTTFEIREFDPLAKQDVGLLWRVTVDTAAPVILPAPGAPVVVRECRPDGTVTAKSNLVAPLRWAAPDPLRRLALFQRGYLVYRMRRAFAEAAGYHTTPPSVATLHSLVLSNPTNVKQVTPVPVFSEKNLTAAEATNLVADSKTIFFTDANDADEVPGMGPQFQNGEMFYYFVTARDLLGREGAVSPAGFAEIYELTPLDAPRDVRATNDFLFTGNPAACADQRLLVSWKQADNTGTTRPVLRYHVYRWTSVNDIQLHADDFLPIATLPHTANNGALSYKDDAAPGAPTAPIDTGRLYFYTVRAEATLPCGPVRSPHSGPMSASLHDCTAPIVPPSNPPLESPCYVLSFTNTASLVSVPYDNDIVQFELTATRNNPLVDFAEFTVVQSPGVGVRLKERVYFDESPSANTVTLVRSLSSDVGAFGSITCLIGTRDGKIAQSQISPTAPRQDQKLVVNFGVQNNPMPPGTIDPNCVVHFADPTGTGDIVPLKVCMNVTADTREYRMYSQIDDGPLMLVKQGFRTVGTIAETICYDDDVLTAGVAEGSYYGQLFNDQGNSGPLVLLGKTEIVRDIPKPLLTPIAASGTAAAPTMTLHWFCQPSGIERFEFWISAETPPAPAENFSVSFSGNRLVVNSTVNVRRATAPTVPSPTVFKNMHYTARIGSAELGDGPLFTIPLNTKPGVTYTIFVRAVTAAGVVGFPSNAQSFAWTPPAAEVGTVPWPARGLPRTNTGFNAGIVAQTLRVAEQPGLDPQYPLGVKVGTIAHHGFPEEFKGFAIDPNNLIFRDGFGASLFPCVLYRFQVANAAFPQVSGDLTQASPLMKEMALLKDPYVFSIHDPFICSRSDTVPAAPAPSGIIPNDAQPGPGGLYLRDTQPALKGAAYKYLVVRFKTNGEVTDIIPTNVVTLPE